LLPQQFALGDNPLRKIMMTAVIGALAVPATSAAIAADLIVDEPAVVAPSASDLALYGKLYGGVTLENTLAFGGDDYDLDPGYMLGAAVGVGTGIEGLSVELDVTGSLASYTGYDESLGAVTLMGNVVYTAGVSDMFKLYGGVGLGAVLGPSSANQPQSRPTDWTPPCPSRSTLPRSTSRRPSARRGASQSPWRFTSCCSPWCCSGRTGASLSLCHPRPSQWS
jgi:hypothetical protein